MRQVEQVGDELTGGVYWNLSGDVVICLVSLSSQSMSVFCPKNLLKRAISSLSMPEQGLSRR